MESTANVINVEGSLDEILLQLDPKTLWHGEQIVAERIMELTTTTGIMAYSIYPTLAAKDFFLPNVLYFTAENTEGITAPFLYIGRGHVNPLLESSDAREHFRREGLYIPSDEEVSRIVSHTLTKKIPLSDLKFMETEDESPYRVVVIDRGKYKRLNQTEKVLVDSFFWNEQMFNQQQEFVHQTSTSCDAWIVMDTPKQILEKASGRNGFCSIGVIHRFSNESSVYLNIDKLDYRYFTGPTYMRGQPRR